MMSSARTAYGEHDAVAARVLLDEVCDVEHVISVGHPVAIRFIVVLRDFFAAINSFASEVS